MYLQNSFPLTCSKTSKACTLPKTQIKYMCNFTAKCSHLTQHSYKTNSLQWTYFPQALSDLLHTCSSQSQQTQQATHGQQRLHFNCQGSSLHRSLLYIPLQLKVRGHNSGGGTLQLHPYQPFCVRTADWTNPNSAEKPTAISKGQNLITGSWSLCNFCVVITTLRALNSFTANFRKWKKIFQLNRHSCRSPFTVFLLKGLKRSVNHLCLSEIRTPGSRQTSLLPAGAALCHHPVVEELITCISHKVGNKRGVIKKVQIYFFSSLQRPVYPSFYKQNITAFHRPGLMGKKKITKIFLKKCLSPKNGKQDEKDRYIKNEKNWTQWKALTCVQEKSSQNIDDKNKFLITESGSTEQQVLHIKYLKFHQKTAVLQHNVQKHFRDSVSPTNSKPQPWFRLRLIIYQQNTTPFDKISQT